MTAEALRLADHYTRPQQKEEARRHLSLQTEFRDECDLREAEVAAEKGKRAGAKEKLHLGVKRH